MAKTIEVSAAEAAIIEKGARFAGAEIKGEKSALGQFKQAVADIGDEDTLTLWLKGYRDTRKAAGYKDAAVAASYRKNAWHALRAGMEGETVRALADAWVAAKRRIADGADTESPPVDEQAVRLAAAQKAVERALKLLGDTPMEQTIKEALVASITEPGNVARGLKLVLAEALERSLKAA